ncbi:MAG: glycoside hydrolase family 9 protein [Candidatus Kryptonium sp.]
MKKVLLFLTTLLFSSKLFAPPRTGGAYYNYGEALQKSIFFYLIQRSGDLPEPYPVIWRADDCLDDGKDVGLDLTGGWHDCGDGVKVGNTIVYALSQLAWAVYEYKQAFVNSGLLDEILDEIKWGADYLIKCHPEPNVFYYYVGNATDHDYWIPHEVLHLMTTRPAHKVDPSTPGSDVSAGAAAGLALTSILFKDIDPEYSQLCLKHARELFDFADTYRGISPSVAFYGSSSYLDDLAWAAVWLYLATDNQTYLQKAESFLLDPNFSIGGNHTHCWDDVRYGATLKMAQLTGKSVFIEAVERNLDHWVNGVPKSPGGLCLFDGWGNLRYVVNACFLAFVWSDCNLGTVSKKQIYRNFAEGQINYILGDNPNNMSYIVGFSTKYPQYPHHRTAHSSWCSMIDVPTKHTHIAYGLLVGGPNNSDEYYDDVRRYEISEGGTDYNAALVGCLAKMYLLYGGQPLSDFPSEKYFTPPEQRRPEYFVRGWIAWQGQDSLDIIVQLNNRSAWPPTIKDKLSCRYFVDLTEVISSGVSPSSIQVIPQGQSSAVISQLIQWHENIYCVVVDFTGTLIHPGRSDLCEKMARFQLRWGAVPWNHSNDWSYQQLTQMNDETWNIRSFAGTTPYIPVYEDGILLWGQEPPRANDTTAPQAPTGLTAFLINPSQVKLTWSKNSELDLAGYRLYRSTYPNFLVSAQNLVTELKTREYIDKNLKLSTTYYYRLTAIDTSGNESQPSSVVSIYITSLISAPKNLKAKAVSPYRVDLSWDKNTEPDFSKYKIYRSTDNINFVLLAETKINTYSDTSVSPQTTYYYYLTAVDKYSGESSPSEVVSVVTLQQDKTPPQPPTGLKFIPVSLTRIDIDWDDNTEEDLSHYIIHRSTIFGFIPSSFTYLTQTTTSYYVDTAVEKNTRYYYRIFAVDAAGNISQPSQQLEARPVFELEIHAKDINEQTDTAWTKLSIRIVSNTGEEVPMNELKFRFYFTKDEAQLNALNAIHYVGQLENPYTGSVVGYMQSNFYPIGPITLTDTYLEVTFSTGAPSLKGKGQYAYIEIAIYGNNAIFNVTNDYSYTTNKTSYTPFENITLYRNNKLVWGKEPGPPTAAFTFQPLYPKVDQQIQFFDYSYDTNGEVVRWIWNFGDGNTSTQRNPLHTYTQPGIYLVTLTVEDNDGQTSQYSLQIRVSSEDEPPTCSIISPQDGKIVYGLVTITAQAQDDVGIKNIELYINNQFIYTTTAQILVYQIHTSSYQTLPDDTLKIKVIAYDTKNQQAQHEISVVVDAPPSCKILSPQTESNVFGIITISGTAHDDKGIKKLEIYVDGEAIHISSSVNQNFIYLFNTRASKLPDGQHEIKVVVYDTRNQQAEDKLVVYLENRKYAVVKKHIFVSLNNDNINEKIDFTSEGTPKRVLIYDTKGELIEELKEDKFIWDVKINGNFLKTGLYIYRLENQAGKTITGTLIVIK